MGPDGKAGYGERCAGLCRQAPARLARGAEPGHNCGSLEYISALTWGRGQGAAAVGKPAQSPPCCPHRSRRTPTQQRHAGGQAGGSRPPASRCTQGPSLPPPADHHPSRRLPALTVDVRLERRLRLRALELEGGRHHAVLHAERVRVEVHGSHLLKALEPSRPSFLHHALQHRMHHLQGASAEEAGGWEGRAGTAGSGSGAARSRQLRQQAGGQAGGRGKEVVACRAGSRLQQPLQLQLGGRALRPGLASRRSTPLACGVRHSCARSAGSPRSLPQGSRYSGSGITTATSCSKGGRRQARGPGRTAQTRRRIRGMAAAGEQRTQRKKDGRRRPLARTHTVHPRCLPGSSHMLPGVTPALAPAQAVNQPLPQPLPQPLRCQARGAACCCRLAPPRTCARSELPYTNDCMTKGERAYTFSIFSGATYSPCGSGREVRGQGGPLMWMDEGGRGSGARRRQGGERAPTPSGRAQHRGQA